MAAAKETPRLPEPSDSQAGQPPTAADTLSDSAPERAARVLDRLLPFLLRYLLAGALYLYFRAEGVARGLLSIDLINGIIGLYAAVVSVILLTAPRDRRLGPRGQQSLIIAESGLIALVFPHDPNPGMPLLIVAFAALAVYGLRLGLAGYRNSLRVQALALAVLLALRAFHTETGLSAPDVWMLLLYATGAAFVSVIIVGRERGQRRRADLNERYSLAVQGAKLGIWEVDLHAKMTSLDAATARMHGLPARPYTAPSEQLDLMIHPDDRARVRAEFQQTIGTGSKSFGTDTASGGRTAQNLCSPSAAHRSMAATAVRSALSACAVT